MKNRRKGDRRTEQLTAERVPSWNGVNRRDTQRRMNGSPASDLDLSTMSDKEQLKLKRREKERQLKEKRKQQRLRKEIRQEFGM